MNTAPLRRVCKVATALLGVLLLGACSTVRTVDTSVNSFAGQPAAVKGATYRFEQLPSHSQQAKRAELEALTETALTEAGLKRNDAAARYSVEVGLLSQTYQREAPILLVRHSRVVMASDGTYWQQVPWGVNSPWYHYQLRLVMRDTTNALVSYETTAELDTPWADAINMIPALLKAALRDYPLPPSGPRKITLEVGNAQASEH